MIVKFKVGDKVRLVVSYLYINELVEVTEVSIGRNRVCYKVKSDVCRWVTGSTLRLN